MKNPRNRGRVIIIIIIIIIINITIIIIIIILKKPTGKDRNWLNLLIILTDLRVKFARWFVKSIHYSKFIFLETLLVQTLFLLNILYLTWPNHPTTEKFKIIYDCWPNNFKILFYAKSQVITS